MSLDISAYLECRPRDSDDPRWTDLAHEVFIARDYTLFAILANVRNDNNRVPAIASPRGLPDYVTSYTEQQWEQFGGGDASYLQYAELVRAQEIFSNLEQDWYEGRLVPRETELGPEWRVYAREQDIPSDLLARLVFFEGGPPGYTREQFVIAVSHHLGKFGPHQDLTAILAYLSVYEADGYETRMVFWFS